MLAVEDVTVAFGARPVLDGVRIAVVPGTVTIVVGPNGAGKSTLLKAMTGEIRPRRGCVLLDGRDIARLPPAALAARRAVLPQSTHLAFPFTVREVVQLGLAGRPRLPPTMEELPEAALARVDLAGFGGRFFQELSGGEQQRVHLARVLCQVWEPVRDGLPCHLLLDEPTASLDIRHQLMTLAIARAFAAAGGGAFAILHDLNLAAMFADRLVVMDRGRVAADGPPAEILTDGLMAAVFGVAIRVSRPPADATPYLLPQTATMPGAARSVSS